jgi:DNA-binding NtrC family response regulator
MRTTAIWENDSLGLMSSAPASVNEEQEGSRKNLKTLKELTIRLLREVQCIGEVQTLNFKTGLDFYDEVSRFEIDLIKRALFQTGGHQGRAARLLNLKVTTLNSKIKHYRINLEGFSTGYGMVEGNEIENHQHA